jgi:hypothetical protein
MFTYIALIILSLSVSLVVAEASDSNLREKITQSLESLLAAQSKSESKGVENCENKCDKAFNRFAYEISTVGSSETYEFRACVAGCQQCTTDLESQTENTGNCFRTCKETKWADRGILKGVIEPDKACMGGCIIQTCQVICAGGTTDPDITRNNKQFFYPNGGCSIKTERYSQNFEYVPWDSPNSGQGGSFTVAQCCANALSLCEYVGDKASENYVQLLDNTGRICSDFVPSRTQADICNYYSQQRNCGAIP